MFTLPANRTSSGPSGHLPRARGRLSAGRPEAVPYGADIRFPCRGRRPRRSGCTSFHQAQRTGEYVECVRIRPSFVLFWPQRRPPEERPPCLKWAVSEADWGIFGFLCREFGKEPTAVSPRPRYPRPPPFRQGGLAGSRIGAHAGGVAVIDLLKPETPTAGR